jgi:hypothetical protein
MLNVTTAEGAPLRFNKFYFPGWQVRLADGTLLPTYPTTNLGLLTVNLPAGSHQVTLTWAGTITQRVAGAISMVALALLAGISLWQGARKLAIVPLLLLVIAVAATFWRPTTAAIGAPTEPLEAFGVRLLGYRSEQSDPTRIYLYPYWYLHAGKPSPTLQARWQLLDEAGTVRSEILSGPYFNASTPATWPPGTLIEDAYMLPLPPGLTAGNYSIKLQLEADGAKSQAVSIGAPTLPSPTPPQEIAMVATNALFDDEITLAGYAAPAANQLISGDSAFPIFKAGEVIRYRLYWRAVKTPSDNYHSYIHLIDSAGNAIYQSDQLPGPWFRPPKGWDSYYLQQDSHRLEIPSSAPGGLYWPTVGLYEIYEMNRMAVTVDGQPVEGDVFRLPPVKVIGAPAEPPTERMARFDDGFHLMGYALHLPEGGLSPGVQFQVTLYYRSDAKTDKDYTRFFHLYNPNLGLAAQADSPPQGGINPTWAWVPGETIIDTVMLQVAENAAPGEYRLFTGFYDAQVGAVRLGVQDEAGQPLPDNGVILETVEVQGR